MTLTREKNNFQQQIESTAGKIDLKTSERLDSIFVTLQSQLKDFPQGFSGSLHFPIPADEVMVLHGDMSRHVTKEVEANVVGGKVQAILLISDTFQTIYRIEKSASTPDSGSGLNLVQKLIRRLRAHDITPTYDVAFAENKIMAIPIAVSIFEGMDLKSPCSKVSFPVVINGTERIFVVSEVSDPKIFSVDVEGEQHPISKDDSIQTIAQLIKEFVKLSQETES